MNGSGKIVTLVIHGTFARDETWWRLGVEGEETFADRLEAALARRGLAWTVWRPALGGGGRGGRGLDYDDFSWSGRNRHGDRVKGARQLRRSLAALAQKLSATPGSPVTLNIVAHSHGGNVVLEALRSLPAGVRLGRVVLLGTPLLAARPALRALRALVSLLLLLTVIVLWIDAAIYLFDLVTPGSLVHTDGLPAWGYGPLLLAVVAAGTLLYGLLATLVATLGDVVWRAILYPLEVRWAGWVLIAAFAALMVTPIVHPPLYRPDLLAAALLALFAVPVVARYGWRWAQRVYGPTTPALVKALREEPIVLLTSRQDESALLLQFSSAPRELYAAEVRHRIRKFAGALAPLLRALELVIVRPAVVGLALRALEVLFERAALGFGLFRLLFFDYGLADLGEGRAYPAGKIVRRVDVTDDLKPAVAVMPDPLGVDPRGRVEEAPEGEQIVGPDQRHAASLRQTLIEVIEYLRAQIKFRHSLYYESPQVIERVAAIFAADSSPR